MLLEFIDVNFRNFLSYGNTWSQLEFKQGTNFIISGDKIRANTMGKSSLLRTISFALFGKIPDVNKPDIINWSNGKNCEVHIKLKKCNDVFIIKRGLRPNYLEIEKNDIDLPIDSDLRVAQDNLENDILGMNYDIFNNLIVCNPNNTISILDTTAQKKRKFIENIFSDISYFSSMMDKTNEKLKALNRKINKNNSKMEFIDENINSLKTELQNFELPDIQGIKKNYENIKNEYDNLYDDNIENEISDLQEKLKIVKSKIKKYDDVEGWFKTEISKKEFQLNQLHNEFNELKNNQHIKDDLLETEKLIERLEEEQKTFDYGEYEVLYDEIVDLEYQSQQKKAEMNMLEKHKKTLKPDKNLKEKNICPTCGRNIKFDEIEKHFIKEREKLDDQIKSLKSDIKDKEKNIRKLKNKRDELTKNKDEKEKIDRDLSHAYKDKEYLESFMKNMKSIDDVKKNIEKTEKTVSALKKGKSKISNKNGTELLIRDSINSNLNLKNDKLQKSKELQYSLKQSQMEFNHAKSNLKSIKERIQNKKDKIKSHKQEKEELQKSNIKLGNLKDHFDYLKESLKDENIKAHIINNVIPYLNQKVNEYLSNLGFDFYVIFDKWLNVKLFGPGGRYECKLGNMSGGETKSIDLATKFAIMDIAKIKADVFPDVLVLDEILDSSIDDFGLDKLMEIIKQKQENDGLKIFVVSHRKELGEFTPDNVYKICKKNNFSYIEGV